MWSDIDNLVKTVNTFVEQELLSLSKSVNTFVDEELLSPSIVKKIPFLMDCLKAPTDADTSSVPLLWQHNARNFSHLALILMWQNTPPPNYYVATVNRVALAEVPLPTRTPAAVKPPITEMIPRVLEERDAPVPVVSTHAVETCPSVPVTITPPVVVSPREQLVPNPYSGRIPHINKYFDDGRGARPVVHGTGSRTDCHVCGISGFDSADWSHTTLKASAEHEFESRRQESWFHVCVVCDSRCSGYSAFRDHVAGKRHRKKLRLHLWPVTKGYCMGPSECRLKCCVSF